MAPMSSPLPLPMSSASPGRGDWKFAAAIAAITAFWIPGVLNFEVGPDFPFFVRRTRRMTLRMRNGSWLEWAGALPRNALEHFGVGRKFFYEHQETLDCFTWFVTGETTANQIDLFQL